MKRNQSGFTLIEIAIVLVIIGLLLGGVLKGQELINSAKVKNLATDFKNIPIYVYGYQDKFRALPGDDPRAESHVSSTHAGNGNGMIDGEWDENTGEAYYFWEHVRLAGLAAGPTTGNLLPTNSVGGDIGIQSAGISASAPIATMTGTYVICSKGILGKFAKQMDIQMDDGVPNTGSMRATTGTTGIGMTAATGVLEDAITYTVCMGV
ncbi:MAG: prepilin-type N-terminal cleavage/methylation domain-containing protein [Sideroxyarcus sp.]|nr:prepilin-type N-terminal cleavage/methylation domain-containing protein [Sideroxyarcus sp.]